MDPPVGAQMPLVGRRLGEREGVAFLPPRPSAVGSRGQLAPGRRRADGSVRG